MYLCCRLVDVIAKNFIVIEVIFKLKLKLTEAH